MLNDKLKLLSVAVNYDIQANATGIEIKPKYTNMRAIIKDDKDHAKPKIKYIISAVGEQEIDMSELKKLEQFCEFMVR